MQNNLKQAIKATIFCIIVAFIIVIAFWESLNLFWGQKIDELYTIFSKVAINSENSENAQKMKNAYENAQVDDISKLLSSYPEYGTKYANIKINKIDVDLPVYFGNTLDILKNGVGHDSGSFFPGEGGTIIYMGHNSKKVFRRFSELQINDEIEVTTSYGKFIYTIYDMQLVNENETEKLPIQKEKEILMIYTCYPFNNVGYTTQRYVVYAKLEVQI